MPQIGKIAWIGIRPAKKAPLQETTEATVSIEEGLIGDHYKGNSKKRQVTLIQAEHLQVMATILQKPTISPLLTRRNIVVSGINLLAFTDQKFRLGNDVILKMTGLCHPCSRMEENLGIGGHNAMRGHGGITAQVIRGGVIHKGDKVQMIRA